MAYGEFLESWVVSGAVSTASRQVAELGAKVADVHLHANRSKEGAHPSAILLRI